MANGCSGNALHSHQKSNYNKLTTGRGPHGNILNPQTHRDIGKSPRKVLEATKKNFSPVFLPTLKLLIVIYDI